MNVNTKVVRSSNLELYRIICMLLIVAHHSVVNSGLTGDDGPLQCYPQTGNTLFLYLFGLWGKTGINCFLMITGYFMCKSNITIRKFVKFIMWIYFYKIIIFTIFLFTGYETIGILRVVKLLMPTWGFAQNFTGCFIFFWLTIPFWNILIKNMTKRNHEILLLLLLGMYSILGSIPKFNISFNYVTWFGIIYLIASYIRLYPISLYDNKKLWMWLSLASFLFGCLSILVMHYKFGEREGFFVSDSNKFFAVVIALTSFMWFKNINIPYNKYINMIGGSTFGVLLIHANSDAMRQWLWKDFVDCVGHYSLPFWQLVGYSVGVVLAIFFSCVLLDRVRIVLFEEPFFKWYDKKPRLQKITDILQGK